MVVFHDNHVVEPTGVIVLGEAPAIGGDDDGGLAGEPIQAWIGRDEGGKDSPLTVGEVGGEAGMTGWKGRILCTFSETGKNESASREI